MANVKISQLPDLNPQIDSATVLVSYNGKNYKTSIKQIRSGISTNSEESEKHSAARMLSEIPVSSNVLDGTLIEAIYKSEDYKLHAVKSPLFVFVENLDGLDDITLLNSVVNLNKSYITSYLIPVKHESKLIGYKEYILTANGFKLIYDPSIFVTKEYADETFTKYVDFCFCAKDEIDKICK
jgi:hypothetical protein